MLDLEGKAISLLLGLAIGITGSWYFTSKYKDALLANTVAQMSLDAAAVKASAAESAVLAERANARKMTELELSHAATKKKLAATAAANRRLALERGGLHDAGASPDRDCSVPAAASPATEPAGTPTGCKLSAAASGFLHQLTEEADQVASDLATCSGFAHYANEQYQAWLARQPGPSRSPRLDRRERNGIHD